MTDPLSWIDNYLSHEPNSEVAAAVDALRADREQWKRRAEAAEAFKRFVHSYLDAHHIPEGDPTNQHQIEGCRIGARLDLILARAEAAEKDRDKWKLGDYVWVRTKVTNAVYRRMP